ncbi:MAG: protein translocase subunit SecD [Gammaproteobacteria bacterium]|nr:protein translocase subunit SecD [Gammaproteobacteria bacterium]MDH4313814.1 protein translocase subunit SecD [Gammaproteobacteria bacterium]MDH5214815.1 protein translocase subunit SecD [Gammaproteobacteria bacterium]MDH5501170.1 protein translocase subunit SecD [Gammaproteobacteria bacterium]
MNRYPTWLNWLVLAILLIGILLAMPNIYGTVPAVQVANSDGRALDEMQIERFSAVLTELDIEAEAAYIEDGRVVFRFTSVEDQAAAGDSLRQSFLREATVALTLTPKLPAWIREIGLRPMSLGLDLRGGVHVLLEVDMADAIAKRLNSYQQDFENRLREAGIRHRVDVDDGVITVRLQGEEDIEPSRDIISDADPELLIFDGVDGRSLQVRMSEVQISARQDFALEQNITTLRNRVNQLGVSEPVVQRQGLDRIVVQLPGVQDPNQLDEILTATATLEFRLVDVDGNSPGSRRYPGREGIQSQILKREVIASGDQIIHAESGFSEGQPAVFITLDAAGGENMLETTRVNVNKPMATVFIETRREPVIVNGETEYRTVRSEEIINTATIRGIFKDRFQTTGLTPVEARDLALLLRAGALAAPVYKVEERTIGPSLGQDNIDRGFQAVVIGFVVVVLFTVIYYNWFGVIASLALFSNVVFIVALLGLLQASLTLPGIAGIVLTVGMAIDANVLIFERIREEVAAGSPPQVSINGGYEKALSSIADANITTLIAAIVLFAFGTGPVKGFAVTLSLGIVTSMFTAIVGTRTVINLIFGGRKISRVPV